MLRKATEGYRREEGFLAVIKKLKAEAKTHSNVDIESNWKAESSKWMLLRFYNPTTILLKLHGSRVEHRS